METCLRREIAEFSSGKETFVREFSEHDFKYLVDGWQVRQTRLHLVLLFGVACLCYHHARWVQDKLSRLDEQKWGLFSATKQPAEE